MVLCLLVASESPGTSNSVSHLESGGPATLQAVGLSLYKISESAYLTKPLQVHLLFLFLFMISDGLSCLSHMLFPPVSMLVRVIPLLDTFQGTALVVTPAWETRTWYLALASRAKERFLLPHPFLFQRVGGRLFSNPSKVWSRLLCWRL